MVHADKLIACRRQRADGFLQDLQLLLSGGQIGIFNLPLSGKERGQMRIVKHAQAVRIELGDLLQGKGEVLRRLLRQAINEADIGRGKTNLPRMVEQIKDERFVLLTVNQTLNLFIEVLYAHTQAVETLSA